jgi:glutathione S-transferase
MAFVQLVLALALLEFVLFAFAVGRARVRYNVPAPAMSGNPVFERYFRVQMNTLEQLVIFGPALFMFAYLVNAYVAALLGAVFIVGRALYFYGYVQDPKRRHIGFLLSVIPNFILLGGAIFGALRAMLAG